MAADGDAGVGVHSLGHEEDTINDAVWEYAKLYGLAIVSKDSEFFDHSVLALHPPKIIWVRLGNGSTQEVARVLRAKAEAVRGFLANNEETCMSLGLR